MKRAKHFLGVFLITATILTSAQAMIVHDPINALYNQIRNTLMELQHVEAMANAMERLMTLRKTLEEMIRFHSGFDEIRSLFIGDFKRLLPRFNPNILSNMGYQLSGPQRDFYALVQGSGGSSSSFDYRRHLDTVFGEDPRSTTKPYITQEELFAADGFRMSSEVRMAIEDTMTAGEDISRAAQIASPKGAARLSADALGKILVAQAQTQQNQAKLIEIGATQIEQVSREEKYYERERLKFMQEFNYLLDNLPAR